MSRTVHVDLQERGYDILIGCDPDPGEALAGERGARALIVSDANVDPLYGPGCEARLRARGIETSRAVVPAGEESKSLERAGFLYGKALEAGLDRSSLIVALGGGMVGDLAGFVAATFLRGIRFIQIPTSLLAMVDSAVGGKTGVNLDRGKNLVGAFHQPMAVVSDLAALKTLPEREYRSGLAEVVKYGVIWDAPFFSRLEAGVERLLARDPDFLEEVVGRCCEVKAEIVAVDERESGVRAILNFGHTFGHALEQVSGYSRWLHGEAVAAGMVYAAEVSVLEKGFPAEDGRRLALLLERLGLKVERGGPRFAWAWEDVRAAMSADKKALRSAPRFVLAERLGAVVFGCDVAEETLEKAFRSLQCRP
jgi:3-dehydroquinate synthase